MKLAIITLTPRGKKLGEELNLKLEKDHTIIKVDFYHKQVKQTLKKIFREYDCILGIMASGIMIRNICPMIKNKTIDPSVLVMDEKGTHVISLLSGHLGGGNEHAVKIAELVGAEPVITTATDVNGKMGIDTLARKYFMELDELSNMLHINTALVSGEKVKLKVPPRFKYLFEDELVSNSYEEDSSLEAIETSVKNTKITLTPKMVVVGVGARRGVSMDAVLHAVGGACSDLGIPVERIDIMATAEPKKDEQGIVEAALKLGMELEVVSLDELKKFTHPEISQSQFVMKTFGVPGVCESAALYVAGGHAKLVYRKNSFNKVTVAVAVSN